MPGRCAGIAAHERGLVQGRRLLAAARRRMKNMAWSLPLLQRATTALSVIGACWSWVTGEDHIPNHHGMAFMA
jgi:hypothetical protein